MISDRAQPTHQTDIASPDLELREISKSFGRMSALDNASLIVRKGSIHALLGENGAGKTTLMRIAFGMIAADSGSISVQGDPVHFKSPADAIAAGIGMVHQQFSLVPEMTVAENVALGGHGKFDRTVVAHRIEAIGRKMGMELDPFAKVSSLTSSERQKLEIVRTLSHNARTLILDEPTAVLTPTDIGDLFAQLRAFADDGGSIVLITHKLRDAIEHADEVTVLRHGRRVLNSPMRVVDQNDLAKAMLGESTRVSTPLSVRPSVASICVLELKQLTLRDERGVERLTRVSFQVAAGEIVGIAALEGAGRAMLRLIAGRLEPTAGTIRRPRKVGFVPEDRQEEAVIPDFSLTENLALGNIASLAGRIDWLRFEQETASTVEEYGVRAASIDSPVSSLSGGNQQKFVLGRELRDQPELLVLENPTQGLDVHAAESVHEKIRAARDSGTGIVMYSSDLDELAALSDRVAVVSRGTITVSAPDKTAIGNLLLETATANG